MLRDMKKWRTSQNCRNSCSSFQLKLSQLFIHVIILRINCKRRLRITLCVLRQDIFQIDSRKSFSRKELTIVTSTTKTSRAHLSRIQSIYDLICISLNQFLKYYNFSQKHLPRLEQFQKEQIRNSTCLVILVLKFSSIKTRAINLQCQQTAKG